MEIKIAQKMLLMGLMLGVATVTRSADEKVGKEKRGAVAQNANQEFDALLKAYGNNPNEAFLHAAQNNLLWAIQLLLDRGANIEFFDQSRHTALILAAQAGHTQTVEALIARGARIEHEDLENKTALMGAAQGGHTQTVEALIAHGAQIEYFDIEEKTALMAAAQGGHTATVKALIAHGAQIDHVNLYDTLIVSKPRHGTALTLAAHYGRTTTVEALLAAGANTSTVAGRHDKRTALVFAAQGNHIATVDALIAHGIQTDRFSPNHPKYQSTHTSISLTWAVWKGDNNITQILVNAYCNQLKKILQEKYTPIADMKQQEQSMHPVKLALPFEAVAQGIVRPLEIPDPAANSCCRAYTHDPSNTIRNQSIIELKQKMIQFVKFAISTIKIKDETYRGKNERISQPQEAFLKSLQNNDLKIAENLDISALLTTCIVSPQQPACALDADKSDVTNKDLDADIAGPAPLLTTCIVSPQQPACALDAGKSNVTNEDLDADIAGPAPSTCNIL